MSSEKHQEATKRVTDEVVPIAKQFINKISMYCNNRFPDGRRMTGAVACKIMERSIVSIANQTYNTDPDAGRKLIESVYEAAKTDAVNEWEALTKG